MRIRIPSFALAWLVAGLLGGLPCPAQNRIVLENRLPGSPPGEWDVPGPGDPSIEGFATRISVSPGESVDFKIRTGSTDYRIDIYRLGYYGGLGARFLGGVEPSAPLPQDQPPPLEEPSTGLIDAGNWSVSATWTAPVDAVSGVHVAKFVREDPEDGRASHAVFVVRDDGGRSDVLFQTSDTTWQAYNRWGGNSLYVGGPETNPPRAYKVSYNRPMTLRGTEPWDYVFSGEVPMIRWLERNGYDVSYTTGVDTDRRGEELLEHRVFLSVGHDEYWTRAQWESVEAARDAGVHLAFFSANEIFWKTRWEPGLDASSTPHRTLVCYKETFAHAKIDPLPDVWTGKWRDCDFSPPADGCRPENQLSGQIGWTNALCAGPVTCGITIPAAYSSMRMWRDTAVAGLRGDEEYECPPGTLGYEWDFEQFEAFGDAYPAGRVTFSETVVDARTHRISLYRHASGALVLGAGTVQWSWGLDDTHTDGPSAPHAGGPPDPALQQFTLNILAEMGALPTTLQPGRAPPVPTGDSTAPTSRVEVPADGAIVDSGPIVLSGSAQDDRGRVVRVEVSVDGGSSWIPAAGGETWSLNWIAPDNAGLVHVLSRAVDDLANLETPSPAITLSVDPPGRTALRNLGANPSRGTATLGYDLPRASIARIVVHSVDGRHVRTLVDRHHWAGAYTADWDGRDSAGNRVAGGVYLVGLRAGDLEANGRVVLLR